MDAKEEASTENLDALCWMLSVGGGQLPLLPRMVYFLMLVPSQHLGHMSVPKLRLNRAFADNTQLSLAKLP